MFCKQPLDEGFFRFGHDGQDIAWMASAVGYWGWYRGCRALI
jgi:hypothetical protein